MKIDFLISDLSGGGAQRVMVILANHFSIKGFDVSLITLNEHKGQSYELNKSINRIKLHGGIFKNHKIRSLANLIQYYSISNNRPDVLISFIHLTNLLAIITAKIFGIKIIVSEHNSHLQIPKPKYLTNFTRNLVYRKADFLTVLTAFDINFYKKRKIKVMVMPNPCTFPVLKDNEHIRNKTILAVGSLNRYHHKGFDNLIRLIKPILNKNSDWKLQIVGGGNKGKKYLSKIVTEEGIKDRVEFIGFTNKVSKYMKEAAIFILPSRFEGLPMVLLEAMSQGMACIAYNCKTGPSDILEHMSNGFLIEDQNTNAMQEGLMTLIENKNLRKKLGDNGLNSLEKFSIENIANKWEELFNQL